MQFSWKQFSTQECDHQLCLGWRSWRVWPCAAFTARAACGRGQRGLTRHGPGASISATNVDFAALKEKKTIMLPHA